VYQLRTFSRSLETVNKISTSPEKASHFDKLVFYGTKSFYFLPHPTQQYSRTHLSARVDSMVDLRAKTIYNEESESGKK
jgi:hypothetical protein